MSKVEGTILFEGLIEGPMPPFPDAPAKLEKWAQSPPAQKLGISLQIDGGHFSALISNQPLPVKALAGDHGDPSTSVADVLSDLLRYFPPLERGQVFSTLRSMEWQKNVEVRTLYAVGPDGRVATRQEKVPCETEAPPMPLSRKELLVRAGMGLLIAAVILGLSALFVDYGKMWRQLTARVEPVKTVADMGAFQPYFSAEVTGFDRRNGMLLIRLTRNANYPTSEKALDALYAHPIAPAPPPPASAPASASAPATQNSDFGLTRQRLAVEDLARGQIRLEYHDAQDHLLGEVMLRTADLQDHEIVEISLPAPVSEGQWVVPGRLVLLP